MDQTNDRSREAGYLSQESTQDARLRVLAAFAVLAGLYLSSLYSYPLFHSLAELFSIVIAFGIFTIVWTARPFLENDYLLFVGIAYLFVGGIDLVHTLAYKGMGVFRAFDANHPTQLWIAARALQAFSLVTAPFFMGRRVNHRILLAVYAVLSSLMLWSILYAGMFPDCYREGSGLTPFKKNSEYAISALLVVSGMLVYRKKTAFNSRVLRLILFSIAATMVSEIAFTFYVGVYDLSNLVGHIFKIAAFYAMYAAIIKTGLRDPYEIIFRRLEQSREDLQRAKEDLELRVAERTRELSQSNELYKKEIAERIRAEEELRHAGAYHRSLIEASLDPLVTIGPDGKITDVNAATEGVTGCPRTELIGKDFSDYFTEPDKAREGYRKVFLSGQVRDYPLEITGRDGGITPVLYNATVYRNAAGNVKGVFAAARDVTELRKAEEAVRLNLARQKALLDMYQQKANESVPDIISYVVEKCVALTNSVIGFVGLVSDDGQYMEALLWSQKTMENCPIDKPSHFPLKEAGIWAETVRQRRLLIINDYPAPNVHKKGYPDGHVDLTRFMGVPVIDKDRVVAVAGVANKPEEYSEDDQNKVSLLLEGMWDLISRKKSEGALRESEQRFKRLIESVTDYIYTVRVENGKPVSTVHGPGCVAVTGYTADEYEKDPHLWHHMIFEEDRNAVLEQAADILAGRSAAVVEHRIIHKSGAIRWVRNTPVPRYDEKGILVSYDGLISNVTERKKLEDQLRQAQKMEAIGQLAGGIAHDFNNILSAVIGYGHILLMKMKDDDPLRMNVQHLLESTDRAAHLTHSLLAFSRKQIINPVDVNLNEVIQRMEKFLRRIISEDIELKTILQKDGITVHADSSQLEQVFMNLAANARDAMEHGGRLTIESGVVYLDDSYIRAHGYGRIGWYALVSVSDTGTGMDEATQKRIFEPFFTTKEPGKGTGLGLAMVYGIIKQHSGYINVSSEPGKGTRFKIYLPLVRGDIEKKPAPPIAEAEDLPRGTETILLAEDDDALRKLASSILSDFGYTVIESSNGEEAIELFNRSNGGIRLLILDVIMPKKNGWEVYETVKRVRSDIKVIFTSGYTADRITTEGLLKKGTDVMLKPMSPQDLLKKVRATLDKK